MSKVYHNGDMAPFDPDAPAQPGSGIYGLPHTPDEAAVVVIPVPWDATTSYRAGAARGPAAILAASRQVDLFDAETGHPYRHGIAMLDEIGEIVEWNTAARALAEPVIEVGGEVTGDLASDLDEVNALGARLNERVREEATRWLVRGKLVALVGGDHAAPYGNIEAVAERHPGVGILHLDAHADLRRAYEGFTWSHASIMYNVATRIPGVSRIVQFGIRDLGSAEAEMSRGSNGRIVTFFEPELAARRFEGETWGAQAARIVAELPRDVYLSWDIDGLDPAYCPHTGTPVPGGLSFAQAAYILRKVVDSGRRIVGLDLNEVAPGPAGDEWDANVGARLLYKMIGWAVRSR
jgi:agmatinase